MSSDPEPSASARRAAQCEQVATDLGWVCRPLGTALQPVRALHVPWVWTSGGAARSRAALVLVHQRELAIAADQLHALGARLRHRAASPAER